MRIVDVDSHFHEPIDWLHQAAPQLAAQIPRMSDLQLYLDITVGDLFDVLPASARIDPMSLAPPALRAWIDTMTILRTAERSAADHSMMMHAPSAHSDGKQRLAWMDARGIDAQVISPTLSYFSYCSARHTGDVQLALRVLEAYNRWAAEQCHDVTGRLIPSMVIDLVDVEWSLEEMSRMRKLGSRIALVTAEPVNNKSLSHPDFERVWATAAALGVTVLFHVGAGRASIHPGWGNNGKDAAQFIRLTRLIRRQLPELALGALALGGVFHRHPDLRVLTSELGIEWVPSFLERLDSVVYHPAEADLTGNKYRLPLKPSEYIQRQVRISVVPEYDTLYPVIEQVPRGLIVFASDFPHPEGSEDPVGHYSAQLQAASEQDRIEFFGESAARMLQI